MNKSKKKVQECFFPEKERKSTPVKAASDTGSSSSLEMAIKEKVTPLLEESMEKHWGITIPQVGADISDTLKTSPLNMYVPWHLNFPEFLDLRQNAGDEYRRTRTANTAVFLSDEFMKRVKKADIHPDIYGSDHCPVSITIS